MCIRDRYIQEKTQRPNSKKRLKRLRDTTSSRIPATTMFGKDVYKRQGLIQDPIQWSKETEYMLPLAIIIMLWSALGTQFLVLSLIHI